MTLTLALVFLIAAIVVFVVAALGVSTGRVNLIAAGLALFAAAEIAGG